MEKYKVYYDNWDDFGHKLSRYIILNGSTTSFTIKLIEENENPIVSVFTSIDEQRNFELECKKLGINSDKIYFNLKLEKYSITQLKKISDKQSDYYGAYINSFCRSKDTVKYMNNILNTVFSSNINFKLNSSNYEFQFDAISAMKNRMLCFIGINGSRKSTLLRELFYKYSVYENAVGSHQIFDIDIDKEAFEPRKAIFVSYGLFDKIDENSLKDECSDLTHQKEKFIFHIADLINENQLSDHLKKYLGDIETIKIYLKKHFTFHNKIDWTSFDNEGEVANENKDYTSIIESYNMLSTGEKYAFVFVLVLVGELRFNSLVFIDELEVSQHPQQILKLQNFLNELLEETQSYAILATHSPYIIQNIPSDYVLVVNSNDGNLHISKFPMEVYGMSHDEIARIVFDVNMEDNLFFKTTNSLTNEEKIEITNNGKEKSLVLDFLLEVDNV